MYFVAMTKQLLGHLEIAETGLVAEMDTGFQHLTHGDGHVDTPKVVTRIRLADLRDMHLERQSARGQRKRRHLGEAGS